MKEEHNHKWYETTLAQTNGAFERPYNIRVRSYACECGAWKVGTEENKPKPKYDFGRKKVTHYQN